MTHNKLGPPPRERTDRAVGSVVAPQAPPPPLAGEGREGAAASERKPTWRVKPKARLRARTLRRDLTKAERIIWYGLRAHRLDGAGFRRQTPIGPYIVDFVSHAAKLIVEIDGGQHFETGQEARDRRRDAFLAAKGFRVLRFNNHDVMTNRTGVLETIAGAVREARAPSLPSPASGGGGERGASEGSNRTAGASHTDGVRP
jgi:very-short-patch-repair endonuclease